jgi:hypothetical protein
MTSLQGWLFFRSRTDYVLSTSYIVLQYVALLFDFDRNIRTNMRPGRSHRSRPIISKTWFI